MTTILILIIVLSMSINMNNVHSSNGPRPNKQVPESEATAKQAASTERSVRRVWKNCAEAEEANRMLKILESEGRGTAGVEAYSRGRAGKERWENRGEPGRVQVVREEMSSRIDNSDVKVRDLKKQRKNISNEFRKTLSQNIFKRRMRKILEFARNAKNIARQEQEQKMYWVRLKYSKKVDDFSIPDEVSEFKDVKWSSL